MVEGARLESVYTGNCIKGSNPLVSATFKFKCNADKALHFFCITYRAGKLLSLILTSLSNEIIV